MILFSYTDNQDILLGDGESRYKSWVSSIQGGLVFQLVRRFHRYWAYSSKSTVQPKMESCFQDGACSVCFLLHSLPWCSYLIVWASLIGIYCTLTLRPLIWENDINLWVTKFIAHCKIKGPQSRTIKATMTMLNIVFHQSSFTQIGPKSKKEDHHQT